MVQKNNFGALVAVDMVIVVLISFSNAIGVFVSSLLSLAHLHHHHLRDAVNDSVLAIPIVITFVHFVLFALNALLRNQSAADH